MNNSIKFDIALKATKAIADLKRLQRVAQSTQKNMNGLNKVTANYARNTKKVSDANRGASVSFGKLTASVTAGTIAGRAIAATFTGLTRLFVGLGTNVIKTASDFETLSTQFTTLIGDADKANDLFKDLTEFSQSTPFELKNIADASQKLLAFGFTADEVKTNIRVLGDVSAASGQPLGDLARIFGQISSQGKLTGERLNQLEERGITLGPAISDSLGIAESSFRDFVSKGKVSFSEVEKAFIRLTSEGGRFFEGTIRQSRTAAGVYSTLKDNVTLLGNQFGSKLLPVVKFFGIELIKVSKIISKYIQDNLTLGNVTNFVVSVVQKISNAVRFSASILLGARVAINTFQQAWFDAFSFILGGIEKVIGVVSKFGSFLKIDTSGLDAAKQQFGFFAQGATETASSIELDNKRMIESFANFDTSVANSTNGLKASLDEFIAKDTEVVSSTQANNQLKIESDRASNEARLNELKQFEEQKRSLKEQASIAETEFEIAKSIQDQETQTIRMQSLIERLGLEEAIKFEARLRNAENLRESKLIELEIERDASEKKLELLREEEKNREQGNKNVAAIIAKDNKEFAKRDKDNREALVSGTADMFGSLAQVSALGGKKLFKITKAFNLAEAVTSGVLSVQKAAASAPPPYNIPAIVSATATSVANVARIASQKAPAFEQGGIVPGNSFSGDKVAARVNSGEMILNQAQQQNMFRMLQGGGSTSVNSNVVVEIDGEAIGRAVSKQVANGLELGEVI